MRKRGKKQLAILLSAALVMQGQAVYGANPEKSGGGGTKQEATSEITTTEGEDAVSGDKEDDKEENASKGNETEKNEDKGDEEENSKDENGKDESKKDEQAKGDESGLENGSDQDGEKVPEGENDQENGEEPEKNEEQDQNENGSDDEDGLEGEEDQEKDESSEDEEKDGEEEIEKDTPEDAQKNEDALEKDLLPEIPEVVSEEKEQIETEKKILSWKWKDEQEALTEGELRLSVTEEDQIAFEEIGVMLPAEVTASVSVEDEGEESVEDIEDAEGTEKTEKIKETDIPVLGWSCEDYVQDENGKWPTSGEFIFAAELPEEYVLADGVSALEVKVVIEVPEVALLSEETLDRKIEINGQSKFTLSDNKCTGEGYEIIKSGNNEYKLILNEFSGNSIMFENGNWTVELTGENFINNTNGEGLDLYPYGTLNVTIEGEGSLKVSGTTRGIFVRQNSSLTIDSGTIIANGGSSNSSGSTAGIEIRTTTLTVNGGSIRATGISGSGKGYGINILYDSTLNMKGGSITAVGSGCSLFMGGEVDVSAGTLTTDSVMFDGYWSNTNRLYITESGNVEIASQLSICGIGDPSVDIENGGTLTVNNVDNKGTVTLNEGNLILNGTFTNGTNNTNLKEGSFNYQGGSVTGKGSLPRESKLPVTISTINANTDIAVPGNIDVSKYFTVVNPSGAGDISYSIDYTDIAKNDRGEGKLTGNILEVTKPGKLNVKATVSETEFYA